jgi:hypothetical protein
MNPKLNYMIVQHRIADLRHRGESARLATEVPARRRIFRDRNSATRRCTGGAR